MTAHISDDGSGREESVAEHTEKTVFLCNEKGKRCGLSQIMSLCGIFHDMGKDKRSFNDYLHADESVRRKLRGTIGHAATGAKYIYDKYYDGCSGNIKYMVEMISYAIAAHHGLFDCVDIEHADIFSKRIKTVEDYDEACGNSRRDYLNQYETDKIFKDASDEFNLVWNRIKELFTHLKTVLAAKEKGDARGLLADCKFFLLACLQRLILSILIDSDWEATADFMDNINTLSKKPQFNKDEVFREAGKHFAAYMAKKQQEVNVSRLTGKERVIFEARNTLLNVS